MARKSLRSRLCLRGSAHFFHEPMRCDQGSMPISNLTRVLRFVARKARPAVNNVTTAARRVDAALDAAAGAVAAFTDGRLYEGAWNRVGGSARLRRAAEMGWGGCARPRAAGAGATTDISQVMGGRGLIF
jgi:hypothetical protein